MLPPQGVFGPTPTRAKHSDRGPERWLIGGALIGGTKKVAQNGSAPIGTTERNHTMTEITPDKHKQSNAESKHVHVRYLRLPEVLARIGVSWITVLRWQKEGRFPMRRRLGPNTIAWREDEIDRWCESRPELCAHREASNV